MNNTIYMLCSVTPRQMNSFIITTDEGGVIVVDGGFAEDAEKLLGTLRTVTGEKKPHIDGWFLTHAHDDHISAFVRLVTEFYGQFSFDRVYYNFPSYQFFEHYENSEAHTTAEFYAALPRFADRICIVSTDDVYEIKGAKFEFLYTYDTVITFNAVNNSSSVFKMTLGGKTVLFLGDLGVEAGKKLLSTRGGALKSDFVQMAHHGQNGVDFDVYRAIAPSACLWCTPKWLWDNDAGLGYNTHVFKTVVVRGWMDELGVREHYVTKDGDQIIRL